MAAVAHFLHHAQALPDEALVLDRAVGAIRGASVFAAGDAPADGVVLEPGLDGALRVFRRDRHQPVLGVEREALAQAGALALVADVAPGVVFITDILPDLQAVAFDQAQASGVLIVPSEQVAGGIPGELFLDDADAAVLAPAACQLCRPSAS